MSVADLTAAAVAAKAASDRIRRILLNLDEELRAKGVRVDRVEVDTRRLASMAVHIHIEST